MDTKSNKRAGKWLLAAAGLLVVASAVSWRVENARTEDRQWDADVEAMGRVMGGGGDVMDALGVTGEKVEPNRTLSIVLFSLGGLAALSGVILLAGAQESRTAYAMPTGQPPSEAPPDIAGQLGDLVRMKDEGHLNEPQFEEAKRRLLLETSEPPLHPDPPSASDE